MVQDLWRVFPRLLEQHINALLDEAEPNPTKAFQLYKICQRENLWHESFDKFSEHLTDFFSQPRSERSKSHFDCYLDRPMDMAIFKNFELTFRNALVSPSSLLHIASWAHNIMRISCQTDSSIVSTDVLNRTLQHITNPPLFEKDHSIEFGDFCEAWKKTVFNLFGKKYDAELNDILKELDWLNTELKKTEKGRAGLVATPLLYLTQTEIDWALAVRKAATENFPAPKFPLSRGPQKQPLIEMERVAQLYTISLSSPRPELVQQRSNIRTTLLDRCDQLLRDRAA